MHYTSTTPPASQAAERPAPIDDALVAEVRRCLQAAMAEVPRSLTGAVTACIEAYFVPEDGRRADRPTRVV